MEKLMYNTGEYYTCLVSGRRAVSGPFPTIVQGESVRFITATDIHWCKNHLCGLAINFRGRSWKAELSAKYCAWRKHIVHAI